MQHHRIAYLIADAARGRIVAWDRDTGHFRTRLHIDEGAAAPTAPLHPEGAAFGHVERRRSDHGDPAAARERHLAAFAASLTEQVRKFAADNACEGVVLVAPPRLLGLLKAAVGNRPALLGAVGKDLAHTPDHELGRWLERIDLTAPA